MKLTIQAYYTTLIYVITSEWRLQNGSNLNTGSHDSQCQSCKIGHFQTLSLRILVWQLIGLNVDRTYRYLTTVHGTLLVQVPKGALKTGCNGNLTFQTWRPERDDQWPTWGEIL